MNPLTEETGEVISYFWGPAAIFRTYPIGGPGVRPEALVKPGLFSFFNRTPRRPRSLGKR
jgi:hypothetical protein